ncbi:MAG: hypothetical protein H0W50_00765 [Parachlamydiaceae bacterium]|nr:hypothetical protein [Parachlamydiaceae bacterium]
MQVTTYKNIVETLNDKFKEIKDAEKNIARLNTTKNQQTIAKDYSDFRYSQETSYGLKTAHDSRIHAFAKGVFLMLGGTLGLICFGITRTPEASSGLRIAHESKIGAFVNGLFSMLKGTLGLFGLEIIQTPISIVLSFGMDPGMNEKVILPGYSELAERIRKGAYCFGSAFKDKATILNELVDKEALLELQVEEFENSNNIFIKLNNSVQIINVNADFIAEYGENFNQNLSHKVILISNEVNSKVMIKNAINLNNLMLKQKKIMKGR